MTQGSVADALRKAAVGDYLLGHRWRSSDGRVRRRGRRLGRVEVREDLERRREVVEDARRGES